MAHISPTTGLRPQMLSQGPVPHALPGSPRLPLAPHRAEEGAGAGA